MPAPSLAPRLSGPRAAIPQLTAAELTEYLLEIGGALLSYGCPTHRLEAVIREIAQLEGYQAESFAVPTGLFITVIGPEGPLMRMTRVKEWAVDLGKLAAIDRIFNDVLDDKITLAEGRRRLDEVEVRKRAYTTPLRWASSAGAAGAAAVFLSGGPVEVGLAALGGLLIGIMGTLLGKSSRARLLQDFLGGLLAAGLALVATLVSPGHVSREVLVLSVVILLVPGMALTTGLSELAHKNLVSGASKLMEAMMTFLSILFGIAAMIGLEQALHLKTASVPALGSPDLLVQTLALAVAAGAFGVIFSVPPRLLHTAILSGAIGWGATMLARTHLAASLVTFLGALAVCLYANGLARITKRPSQLYQLPGLVLLVPGSFGFLSLEAFLRGEFLGGAAKGFEMFLTAGAIVTAVLVTNVILPARKLL
jgi:uncharacterized membrane protein YjjP (DUF1212 family)